MSTVKIKVQFKIGDKVEFNQGSTIYFGEVVKRLAEINTKDYLQVYYQVRYFGRTWNTKYILEKSLRKS